MDSKKPGGSIGEDILEKQKTDAKPLQLPKIPVIPLDVMVDVISRLPLKVIIKYKSVSKDFKNIISGHALSRLCHTNNSNSWYSIFVNRSNLSALSFDLAEFDQRDIDNEKGNHEVSKVEIFKIDTQVYGNYFSAWGYCNGLFCLSRINSHYHLFVTNPMLGEVIQLPNPVFDTEDIAAFAYGIGHCQFINRYKVLRIITEYIGDADYKNTTQIFTIGSDQNWRSVLDVNVPYNIWSGLLRKRSYYLYEQTSMLAFRSSLHWVVQPVKLSKSTTTIKPHWGGREYICAFDMTEEKVNALPLPPKDVETCRGSGPLSVFSDKLCMAQTHRYGSDAQVYVWAMDDYGVAASWTKLFSIKLFTRPFDIRYLTLVSLTMLSGVIVIRDLHILVFYDLEKKKCVRAVPLRYQIAIPTIPYVPYLGQL